MKKILYVFPFLLLLTACGQQNVEFMIKDKFITDIVMSSEGFVATEDATDKGYRSLVDPSYKVFIEFSYNERTFQKTCEIDEVYWRQIQQGQMFQYKIPHAGVACRQLSRSMYHIFKEQPSEQGEQ